MKKLSILASTLIFSGIAFATYTEVSCTPEIITGSEWIHNYTVTNSSLAQGIEEFTIWFDYDKYTSIQDASDAALDTDWDQLVWQPNGALQIDGGFDALALTVPIGIAESVSGFAVSFLWTGSGDPSSQYYEIINPDNPSEVLDSGFTTMIPEPTSLMLLIGSLACLARKRRKLK